MEADHRPGERRSFGDRDSWYAGPSEEELTAKILITGTSSGIGLATALELGRAGHQVYATMRNPARAPELGERVAQEKLPTSILTMDVDSDRSVTECFAAVGPIDVLVNNAGIERHGSVEELPMEEFRATMETNYFGALRCIRQVVPGMRERRSGCIINVSSVAGKIAGLSMAAYTASKFALEALSEALAGEMKPFGVRVAIVQPGIIETAMADALGDAPPSHCRQGRNRAALFQAALAQPAPPSIIAEAIRNIIESGTWKLRYPCGPDAEPFLSWRAAMTDEEWIDFNALDAEGFRKRVKKDFGLDLKLPAEDAARA
jgi:NAD(P)-dependent dehydrogenase (short-subunit alcohol dehydrogenase family)